MSYRTLRNDEDEGATASSSPGTRPQYILPPEVWVKNQPVGNAAARYMRTKGYEISTNHMIGEGGFAKVYKAKKEGAAMACKVIDLPLATIKSQQYISSSLPRELDILRSELSHKNIVAIYDIFEPPPETLHNDRVYIFMELLATDLFTFVKFRNGLEEDEAKFLFLQIAAGLEYLHSKDWAHRDIKPQNVLLDDFKIVAKLTDFGLSRRVIDPISKQREKSGTFSGTFPLMAPQIHGRKLYEPQLADVYSLGVTLFFMIENRYPFVASGAGIGRVMDLKEHLKGGEHLNPDDLPGIQEVGLRGVDMAIRKNDKIYSFRRDFSTKGMQFVDYLMSPREEDRPTVTMALEHPWVNTRLHVVSGIASATAPAPYVPAIGPPARSRASSASLGPRSMPIGLDNRSRAHSTGTFPSALPTHIRPDPNQRRSSVDPNELLVSGPRPRSRNLVSRSRAESIGFSTRLFGAVGGHQSDQDSDDDYQILD